jgi:hypothetical protein
MPIIIVEHGEKTELVLESGPPNILESLAIGPKLPATGLPDGSDRRDWLSEPELGSQKMFAIAIKHEF